MSEAVALGGFVLTRPVSRPPYSSAELIPAHVLSLSDCIAPFLPGWWAKPHPDVAEAERLAAAAVFGIEPAALPHVAAWMEQAAIDGRLVWPSVFTSLDGVADFLDTMRIVDDDLVVLGMALPRQRAARYVEDWCATDARATSLLARGEPLPPGGRVLGWEVLGSEWIYSFHSWLCSGLEAVVHERLGVRPNAAGFIDDATAAIRAAELCDDDDLGEPIDYHPWMVCRWDPRSLR